MYRNDSFCLIGPEQLALLLKNSKALQVYMSKHALHTKFLVPVYECNSKIGALKWTLVFADLEQMRCWVFGEKSYLAWKQAKDVCNIFSCYGKLQMESIPYDFNTESMIKRSFDLSESAEDGITMLACAYRIVTGSSVDQSMKKVTRNNIKTLIENFAIQ